MPRIDIRSVEPTEDKIVLLMVCCGLFVFFVSVIEVALPALNSSHEQKSMKLPPTMQIMEFGENPSV